jgi:non-ribosomal peptide synthetase component F
LIRGGSKASIIPKAHLSLLLHQLDAVIAHLLQNISQPLIPLTTMMNDIHLLAIQPMKVQSVPEIQFLHQSVEKNAVDMPNAIAVEFVHSLHNLQLKESLTYFELNSYADQVALLLITQGVRHGQLVPICMERSLASYVAIVAILKARE